MIDWNTLIFIGVIIISLAKFLDIIFIYSREDIHNKFIEYWIYLSDLNFKDSIKIALKKTNNILSLVVGRGKYIYRNLFIISMFYIYFFFFTSSSFDFLNFDIIFDVFLPHILWSTLSFIASILLTKFLLYKAITSKSIFKLFSYIFLDVIVLLVLLTFNPWQSISNVHSLVKINNNEQEQILQQIIDNTDEIKEKTIKMFNQILEERLKKGEIDSTDGFMNPEFLANSYVRNMILEKIEKNLEEYVFSQKFISKTLVILPTFINFILILIILILHFLARPTIFIIERVFYSIAEDPKKSIFMIIASFITAIIAIINAGLKAIG